MKPNDEALDEALSVTQIPEENMREYMRRVLTAAYAAQFKSEDYAGLVKQLRFIDEDTLNIEPYSCEQLCKSAADALEAVLAGRDEWKRQAEICKDSLQETEITLGKYVQENDALKAELASGHMWIQMRATVLEELAMVRAERDALAARLAICERMMDKEYRDAFTVADNSNTVAAQIVSMRHSRKWTQKELAEKCGMHQPQISALEDPDFENFEVATLQRVASAFDVALLVRFVPFSELARLAPVDDDALVEICAKGIASSKTNGYEAWMQESRAAIAAIRPHIEAAERERCAKIADKYVGEWHSDLADGCARSIAAAIRRGE